MSEFVQFFKDRTPEMVEQVKQLVLLESPSHSKQHVDNLGAHLQQITEELGATVEVFPFEEAGDVRLAKWNTDASGKPIMFLMHMDTVWPVGTLETMPIREEDGLLFGPGAIDMKSGIVVALEAVRGLRDRGELPDRPVWMFFSSDEEIGSPYTRDLIKETAAHAGLVLVMEPATESEAIKSWRKGIGRYTLTTKGRASHSGFAPEAGINAVIEAAHQSLALNELNDLPNGTSVSVTMIKGGFASNVIPPDAQLTIDFRFLKAEEAERVDNAIRALGPVLPGAEIEIDGGVDRGPMEYNDQMQRTIAQLRQIAESISLEIHEQGSGGASDGNFTAAMGIPTLDGLGPAGTGLHAAHEQVQIGSIPRRAALLAKLLCAWDMAQV